VSALETDVLISGVKKRKTCEGLHGAKPPTADNKAAGKILVEFDRIKQYYLTISFHLKTAVRYCI